MDSAAAGLLLRPFGDLIDTEVEIERSLGTTVDVQAPGKSQDATRDGCVPALVAAEPRDEALLERVGKSDRDALGVLFRRHATMLRVLAGRILRDTAEAEDLIQEVFLYVFRRAALFDAARGSARSWLIQITYHRAFDRRRHLAARRFYTSIELHEAVMSLDEPIAPAELYENTIEAALGRDALRRINEALTAVQRRVIHLHLFEGYSVQEIGAILGQSVGNIRNHYYRALEKMRKEVFCGKSSTK